jgi:hypothetical protein
MRFYSPDFQVLNLADPEVTSKILHPGALLGTSANSWGGLMIYKVDVGTSVTTIVGASNSDRVQIVVDNQGGATVYLGDVNTVTTNTGITLPNGEKVIFNFPHASSSRKFELYGIVASGTNSVRVWVNPLGRAIFKGYVS